jgi:GNAT superfamily N-acetyltransferase
MSITSTDKYGLKPHVIAYAREDYDEIINELRPLLPVHWAEMAQRQDEIPLDPDFDWYKRASDLGMCVAYTAREDGQLIGYCIVLISPRHAHYAHRWAKDDTIWLRADRRNLGVATGLFDFMEADLRQGGPIVLQIETRHQHPALEFLLRGRGYEETGMLYGKRFA